MFGDRLKILRESSGLSQRQLGKVLESDGSTICLWESGRRTPSLDAAIKVANHFGVPLDYLAGESGIGSHPEIDPDIVDMVNKARALTPDQRRKVLELIKILWG